MVEILRSASAMSMVLYVATALCVPFSVNQGACSRPAFRGRLAGKERERESSELSWR